MRVTHRRARTVIAGLAALAPRALRRFLWRHLLGYDIDPSAVIGHSMIDVETFRAGPGARVASLVLIRGLRRLEMERESYIGPLVWANAVPLSSPEFLRGHDRDTALVLHRCAGVTSMHFIDCCDRVELHEFSVLGGLQSQVLSHAFDYNKGELIAAPVVIGAYTLVSSRALILPGTTIGEKCIIAGGSVLPSGKYEALSLHAGVPAVVKAELSPDAGFFVRTEANIP